MPRPSPTVPRMNGRATGIAIQARATIPSETIAPARVPGTDRLPNERREASRCLSVLCVAKLHLPLDCLPRQHMPFHDGDSIRESSFTARERVQR